MKIYFIILVVAVNSFSDLCYDYIKRSNEFYIGDNTYSEVNTKDTYFDANNDIVAYMTSQYLQEVEPGITHIIFGTNEPSVYEYYSVGDTIFSKLTTRDQYDTTTINDTIFYGQERYCKKEDSIYKCWTEYENSIQVRTNYNLNTKILYENDDNPLQCSEENNSCSCIGTDDVGERYIKFYEGYEVDSSSNDSEIASVVSSNDTIWWIANTTTTPIIKSHLQHSNPMQVNIYNSQGQLIANKKINSPIELLNIKNFAIKNRFFIKPE